MRQQKPKEQHLNGQRSQPKFEQNEFYETLLRMHRDQPQRYMRSISPGLRACVDIYVEQKALAAQKAAYLLGASRVIGIDRFPERLQAARGDRVTGVAGVHHLQCHRAVEAEVGGAVDDAHPATAGEALDAVVDEDIAW